MNANSLSLPPLSTPACRLWPLPSLPLSPPARRKRMKLTSDLCSLSKSRGKRWGGWVGLPGCLRTVWPEQLGELSLRQAGLGGGNRGRTLSLLVAADRQSLALGPRGRSRVALQAAAKGRSVSISRIRSKETSSHTPSCIWGNHFGGGCGLRREGGRAARRGMEMSKGSKERHGDVYLLAGAESANENQVPDA